MQTFYSMFLSGRGSGGFGGGPPGGPPWPWGHLVPYDDDDDEDDGEEPDWCLNAREPWLDL
jgi:hypothetical protein